MPVQMQLSRIVMSDIMEQQTIVLKEVEGTRQLSIVIGQFEASSINKRVRKVESVRPLTHNLLVNVIEALGGEPDSVLINDLRDHTYYARLRVKHQGELVEIDSRPSDAIAVAVNCDPPLPIYVAEDVLDEEGN
jgi:bifunctional DNase/RNase